MFKKKILKKSKKHKHLGVSQKPALQQPLAGLHSVYSYNTCFIVLLSFFPATILAWLLFFIFTAWLLVTMSLMVILMSVVKRSAD